MAKKKENVASETQGTDLRSVVQKIQEGFDEGTFSYGKDEIGNLGVIPFGIISLDNITGIGGIAKGRISEIHGMDGTFKTTMALHAISECQKAGGICAFIDAEFAYSPEYAEEIGVDNENLVLVHPASTEEAFSAIEKLVNTEKFDLIVLDSSTALSPNAEKANEFGSSNMGVASRLNGQFFRKITSRLGKTKTALLILSQLREQLGGYHPIKTVPGGLAIRFYASLRLEIKKTSIKQGDDVKGVTLELKTVKNKLYEPFLTTELEAMFGHGINKQKDMINMAMSLGIINKAGAGWMSYGEYKIQGVDKFFELLQDNPELATEIEAEIRRRLIR